MNSIGFMKSSVAMAAVRIADSLDVPVGVLTALGEPVYTPGSGAIGGEGVEAWAFLASHDGRQELRFEYRRSWESDVAAARVLHYTVVVR